MHATLRVALEDAVREDLLPRTVAKLVRLSSPTRQEMPILTAEEGRLLLRETREDRLFTALVLLVVLGLRRSEALGLRWSDVDLDAGVLHVRQGLHWSQDGLMFLPPKSRRSRRTVPLPQLCRNALLAHHERQAKEGGGLPAPLGACRAGLHHGGRDAGGPNNFSHQFHRWCAGAEVPRVRLHALRHTCVSLLLTLGVRPRVVMEIVGHAALERLDGLLDQ